LQFKIPEKSLFALLLRSPWWVSFLVASAVFFIARVLLPERFLPYSVITAAPFLGIGAFAAWKQLRAPNAAHLAAALETVTTMSWRDFSAAIEERFRADGYTVKPYKGAAADFAMERQGYTTLVSCKRWKAASHGVEALRELEAAREKQEGRAAIYVAAGSLTDNAQRFATEKEIRVLQGMELVQWMRGKAMAQKP
jgi:restriction system protein